MKAFFNKLINNKNYRMKITFNTSIIITICFPFFNAFIGLYYSAVWYGSISIYFIVLAIQKIFVYISNKFLTDDDGSKLKANKIYLINGIIIILLVFALSFSVVQMVTTKKPIVVGKIVAIANAAYAFFKITLAIINLVKANKQDNRIVQTIRSISLVDALVSMISLTVTLLSTFNDEDFATKPMIIGVAVGVSFIILSIGIIMIVNAIKNKDDTIDTSSL